MKFYEIVAIKGEQKITERYMEDGTRFIKHIPFSPVIFVKLQEQFKGKNILVELGANRWIRISKIGENPELKAAAVKSVGEKELSREDIIKIEADMFTKAGFIVSYELKGDDANAITN